MYNSTDFESKFHRKLTSALELLKTKGHSTSFMFLNISEHMHDHSLYMT